MTVTPHKTAPPAGARDVACHAELQGVLDHWAGVLAAAVADRGRSSPTTSHCRTLPPPMTASTAARTGSSKPSSTTHDTATTGNGSPAPARASRGRFTGPADGQEQRAGIRRRHLVGHSPHRVAWLARGNLTLHGVTRAVAH